jgi:hypothetical protein
MTAKEKVKSIYENAEIWLMNHNSPWPRYYVQRWNDSSKWEYLSKYKRTEDAAWEDAWNYIEHQMLRKLEE